MRGVGFRMAFVVLGAVVISALVAWYVVALMRSPATVGVHSADGRPVVELRLQTVGALGPRYANSTWVSYLVRERRMRLPETRLVSWSQRREPRT